MTNRGKTPARHIDGWTSAIIVTINEDFKLPEHGEKIAHARLLADIFFTDTDPLNFSTYVYERGETDITKPIVATDKLVKNIALGKSLIIQFGNINYYDVFGIQHWLQFCSMFPDDPRLGKPKALQQCVDFNQMDENK